MYQLPTIEDTLTLLWQPDTVTQVPEGLTTCLTLPPLMSAMCEHAEIHMRLVGRHQHRNAATAVTAALVLRQQGYEGVNIPAITSGLAKAQLPGRFQVSWRARRN